MRQTFAFLEREQAVLGVVSQKPMQLFFFRVIRSDGRPGQRARQIGGRG